MKNKIIIPTILFIAALIFSFFALSQEKNKSQLQANEPTNQENQQSNSTLSQEKNKNQALTEKTMPNTEPKVESKKDQSESQIILFYGDGCPHCAIVEEYIKENSIGDKISFAQKEVYYNQNNAKELEVKAKICGLSTDSIGVPFLWDGEDCLIGDQDIINFFKQKTNGQ
jgi:glutaredoxin